MSLSRKNILLAARNLFFGIVGGFVFAAIFPSSRAFFAGFMYFRLIAPAQAVGWQPFIFVNNLAVALVLVFVPPLLALAVLRRGTAKYKKESRTIKSLARFFSSLKNLNPFQQDLFIALKCPGVFVFAIGFLAIGLWLGFSLWEGTFFKMTFALAKISFVLEMIVYILAAALGSGFFDAAWPTVKKHEYAAARRRILTGLKSRALFVYVAAFALLLFAAAGFEMVELGMVT